MEGKSKGGTRRSPLWPSGRVSKGDRLGIGPLWRFLSPISLAAKKSGRRRLPPITETSAFSRRNAPASALRTYPLISRLRRQLPPGEARPLHRLRRSPSPFRGGSAAAGPGDEGRENESPPAYRSPYNNKYWRFVRLLIRQPLFPFGRQGAVAAYSVSACTGKAPLRRFP